MSEEKEIIEFYDNLYNNITKGGKSQLTQILNYHKELDKINKDYACKALAIRTYIDLYKDKHSNWK